MSLDDLIGRLRRGVMVDGEYESFALTKEAADALTRLLDDAVRMEFLEWCKTRTELQHAKVPPRPVQTDLHIGANGCLLFLRNLYGQAKVVGEAATVRGVIDAARERLAGATED